MAADPKEPMRRPMPAPKRWLLLTVGFVCVGLGILGMILPLMPGVLFLIIAAAAFAQSSHRFHGWLINHRLLGPPVRAWYAHRVIPPRGKIAAVLGMAGSLAYVSIYVAADWLLPTITAAVMLPCALYVVSRPSRPPR